MQAILLSTVAVLSFLSSIATLLSASADLAGCPMARWPRSHRVLAGVCLFFIGSAAGIGAYQKRPVLPVVLPQDRPAPDTSIHDIEDPRTLSTGEMAAEHPQALTIEVRPRSGARKGLSQTVSIQTDSGQRLKALEAIATRFSVQHSYGIEGALSSSTEHEADLGGLLTTRILLQVTVVDSSGGLVDAFQLTSRGGGFSADAAMHQALERIGLALQNRLDQVAVAK